MKLQIRIIQSLFIFLDLVFISAFWSFVRNNYKRVSFEDDHILLRRPFFFFNQKIPYNQVLEIILDHASTTSIIETHTEYFLVDNFSHEDLKRMANEKGIKVSIVNDMF